MIRNEEEEISIYEVFRVIKKRIRLIISMFALAVILSGVMSLLMKPVYRSSFILRIPSVSWYYADQGANIAKSPLISMAEVEKSIINLHSLRKENRIKELSNLLGIQDEKTRGLVSLNTKVLQDARGALEVTMDISNPALVNEMTNIIVNYLNQNKPLTEGLAAERKELDELRRYLSDSIKTQEDLKNIIIAEIKHGRIEAMRFNPAEMETEIIKLKTKLKNVDNEYTALKGIEVSVEPITPIRPFKPNVFLNLTTAGIISLVLGIYLSLLLERYR